MRRFFLLLTCCLAPAPVIHGAVDESLEFGRDVQPLLTKHCYACHGPADQKGGLRLDKFKAATLSAIKPGDPDASELLHRVTSEDASILMPPPEAKKPRLTDKEVEILRKWIASGAEYQSHWAFRTPVRPTPPRVRNEAKVRNPIDRFILGRVEAAGLTPAGEADKRTLARRAALDLTGLPPSPEIVQAFVDDRSADAYEKYVDKLLALPEWGEHRGRYWLDYARYADTHGVHFDNFREMWSYREWVVHALNKNMPYDQFTIENLAGDLLPNPKLDQLVGSGFNRCNITTNEGGIIDEEYLVLYTRDRIDTTSQVWLGLTAGCAVCHDHKYDPLSQREFYQMAAFFNNSTQKAKDGNVKDTLPRVFVPPRDGRQRWSKLPGEIASVKKRIEGRREHARPTFEQWLALASPDSLDVRPPEEGLHAHVPLDQKGEELMFVSAGKTRRYSIGKSSWVPGPGGTNALLVADKVAERRGLGDFEGDDQFSCSAWVKVPKGFGTGSIVSRMSSARGHRGWDFWIQNHQVGAHVINSWGGNALKAVSKIKLPADEWVHVAFTYDGMRKAAGLHVFINGEEVVTQVEADSLTNSIRYRNNNPLRIGERGGGARINGVGLQDVRVYAKNLDLTEVARIAAAPIVKAAIAKQAEERTQAELDTLFAYWLVTEDEDYRRLSRNLAKLTHEQNDIQTRSTYAHVMQEKSSPPEAYILFRGEYDQRRDRVMPGTPAFLPPLPEGTERNRLGFAKWLLSPSHPLTARVTVNRYWQEVFGEGLVSTTGDFGLAGTPPSHPELLDWLAVEFRESGWDVKRLFKLMVTSATYRQAAVLTPEKLKLDKANMLLSRGPRFRMDAEMVRDHALATSGLLVREVGGPSVKPYQPPGVWEAVAMIGSNTRDYRRDDGDSLYRRSMYTFWKRSAPPASLETFNAPSREFCVVKRERTNTPLQSLTTLNDIQFFEAAKALAELALTKGGDDFVDRLSFVSQRLVARDFGERELRVIRENLQKLLVDYQNNPAEADKSIQVGETAPDNSLDPVELAAWTALVNELMNLDEVLNK